MKTRALIPLTEYIASLVISVDKRNKHLSVGKIY